MDTTCANCLVLKKKIDELEEKIRNLTGKSIEEKPKISCPYDELAQLLFHNPKLSPYDLEKLDYSIYSYPVPSSFSTEFQKWAIDCNAAKAVAFLICFDKSIKGSPVTRDLIYSTKNISSCQKFYRKAMKDVIGITEDGVMSIEDSKKLLAEYIEQILGGDSEANNTKAQLELQIKNSSDEFRWEFFRSALWPAFPSDSLQNGRIMVQLESLIFESLLDILFVVYENIQIKECREYMASKLKLILDQPDIFNQCIRDSARRIIEYNNNKI